MRRSDEGQTPGALLSGLTDAEGEPARPRLLDSLWVPGRVVVTDGWLLWGRASPGRAPFTEKPAPKGRRLLEEFLRLDVQRPETVERYASRYGPLFLCSPHRLPLHHPPASSGERRCEIGELDKVAGDGRTFREPLSAWAEYVSQAQAILAVAVALHRGEPGRASDWRSAMRPEAPGSLPWFADTAAADVRAQALAYGKKFGWHYQWDKLLHSIHRWLELGDVRLTVVSRPDRPEPTPKLSSLWGLFGNLASQLAFAACQASGWTFCANLGAGAPECQELVFRGGAGRRVWCDAVACKRAARNQKSREWYERRGRALRRKEKAARQTKTTRNLKRRPSKETRSRKRNH